MINKLKNFKYFYNLNVLKIKQILLLLILLTHKILNSQNRLKIGTYFILKYLTHKNLFGFN